MTHILLVVSAAAAAASIGAWRAAPRSNKTAESVAAIEIRRRHGEQQPKFGLKAVQKGLDGAVRTFKLAGGPFETVNSVEITILDEVGQIIDTEGWRMASAPMGRRSGPGP